MKKIVLGCVADDFTGASDAASFLVKEGIKTVLFNDIPKEDTKIDGDFSAIVIALKTRTEETEKAVEHTLRAFQWLKDAGAQQLYFKYCSTFDSTKEGNIGPVIDSILEKYNIKYTILCPALPVNKRIVKNGNLFVNGVPLNESSMRNHPLTPMWDSDISKLMEPQGKYECLKLNYALLEKPYDEIHGVIEDFGKDKSHFYVVPDYIEEKHAEKIVSVFGELPLLTGGSGLMSQLGLKYKANLEIESQNISSYTEGKALILAGSCSTATLAQVEEFKKHGGKHLKINPAALLKGEQKLEDIMEFISVNEEKVLIYSSDYSDNVKEVQKAGAEKISSLLESTMAEIAKTAVKQGFKRIIVAGGETSGAVTKALDFDSYIIGESIAPGVPVMIPLKREDIRLVLKSGNFGQVDFFTRALEMTKEV